MAPKPADGRVPVGAPRPPRRWSSRRTGQGRSPCCRTCSVSRSPARPKAFPWPVDVAKEQAVFLRKLYLRYFSIRLRQVHTRRSGGRMPRGFFLSFHIFFLRQSHFHRGVPRFEHRQRVGGWGSRWHLDPLLRGDAHRLGCGISMPFQHGPSAGEALDAPDRRPVVVGDIQQQQPQL